MSDYLQPINASINYNKFEAKSLPDVGSLGNSKVRLLHQGFGVDSDFHFAFALTSRKVFKTPLPKPGCGDRILRALGIRRWVVLRLKDNSGKDVWVKVNQESIRKRLGMSKEDFKAHLKISLDFTEDVNKKMFPLPPPATIKTNDELLTHVTKEGLQQIRVSGDGHCMLRASLYGVQNLDDLPEDIQIPENVLNAADRDKKTLPKVKNFRKALFTFMQQNKANYAYGINNVLDQSFSEFVEVEKAYLKCREELEACKKRIPQKLFRQIEDLRVMPEDYLLKSQEEILLMEGLSDQQREALNKDCEKYLQLCTNLDQAEAQKAACTRDVPKEIIALFEKEIIATIDLDKKFEEFHHKVLQDNPDQAGEVQKIWRMLDKQEESIQKLPQDLREPLKALFDEKAKISLRNDWLDAYLKGMEKSDNYCTYTEANAISDLFKIPVRLYAPNLGNAAYLEYGNHYLNKTPLCLIRKDRHYNLLVDKS